MNLVIYILLFIYSFSLYSESINENKIEKYIVDYSYLKQFHPHIIGIYVIDGDIPPKITEDIYRMSEILNRYINSKNISSEYEILLDINLFNKFSDKHYNHHTELRDLELIKRDYKNNKLALFNQVDKFITKKKDFYIRQNNYGGITFCNDIEKTFLKPLNKFIKDESVNINMKEISSLSKSELKAVWINFKKMNYPIIQKYFAAKADKLLSLANDDSFEENPTINKSKELKHYYLSIKMFGQIWYLELYDDYVSNLHNVSLIKL